jgi:hypothetical protein
MRLSTRLSDIPRAAAISSRDRALDVSHYEHGAKGHGQSDDNRCHVLSKVSLLRHHLPVAFTTTLCCTSAGLPQSACTLAMDSPTSIKLLPQRMVFPHA